MNTVAIPNELTTLMALGIIQPANAEEVRCFLTRTFSHAPFVPSIEDFEQFLNDQVLAGSVVLVTRAEHPLYALSHLGSLRLNPKARRARDKLRLYLLRSAHRHRFHLSRVDLAKELTGASPVVNDRSVVKSGEANWVGLVASLGQPSWPRPARQFRETGSSPSARDTLPDYCSFRDGKQAAEAAEQAGERFVLDNSSIATCLGISPELIIQITHNTSRHYRSFDIAKRGGGRRPIESPRVFLKVIQWYLMDFVFRHLRISRACYGFVTGGSPVRNASKHVGMPFIGVVDIKNFFGSVHSADVERLLQNNNFTFAEAKVLSRLCTKDDVLPQGAPTSPVLSNALLYEFDEAMCEVAQGLGANYTRYADDIAVSGRTRGDVEGMLSRAKQQLRERFGLSLNQAKTRIASRHGRQVVTGIVVNFAALPPREKRREIRAAFHNAQKEPQAFLRQIDKLAGYVGYLNQFPTYKDGEIIEGYRSVLRVLSKAQAEARSAKPGVGIPIKLRRPAPRAHAGHGLKARPKPAR